MIDNEDYLFIMGLINPRKIKPAIISMNDLKISILNEFVLKMYYFKRYRLKRVFEQTLANATLKEAIDLAKYCSDIILFYQEQDYNGQIRSWSDFKDSTDLKKPDLAVKLELNLQTYITLYKQDRVDLETGIKFSILYNKNKMSLTYHTLEIVKHLCELIGRLIVTSNTPHRLRGIS